VGTIAVIAGLLLFIMRRRRRQPRLSEVPENKQKGPLYAHVAEKEAATPGAQLQKTPAELEGDHITQELEAERHGGR
jgi:hypothetical protein